MGEKTVAKFMETSELYLRLTEQNRSATNVTEADKLVFSDSSGLSQYSSSDVNSLLNNYSV